MTWKVFDIVKLRNIEVDEIKEAVNIASTSALPEKSRNRYECTYESCKNWGGRKNVSTVMHKVMLAHILRRSQQLKSPASLCCGVTGASIQGTESFVFYFK
jgi:hypothetical protein